MRETHPERTVIAGPARRNTIAGLDALELPDDEHLVVTIHYYLPFEFTHQGAAWIDGTDDWLGTTWGEEAERERVRADLAFAAEWARSRGRELFLGEFGALDTTDPRDRVEWTELVRGEAERLGLAWAYWDFSTGFGAYDLEAGAWLAPLRDALAPRPRTLVQHAPQNAMDDPDEIARFHDRCSDLMRELLEALAAAPDRPRAFPVIEDGMGWPRRRIASVLGGVSHLRHTEFGGRARTASSTTATRRPAAGRCGSTPRRRAPCAPPGAGSGAVRLITWNVAGRVTRQPEQAQAVGAAGPDVVALQEVTARTLPLWRAALAGLGLEHCETALDHPPEPGRRRLGVLVAAHEPLERLGGPPDVPWPERVLACRLGAIEILNVHSPIAPAPELAKIRTHEAVAGYLAGAGEPGPRIAIR